MAILEQDTGNYYKVLFDECMIKGKAVIAAFAVYENMEQREKEKKREPLWLPFLNSVQARLTGMYQEILAELERLKIQPEIALSKTEENKIDKELYPELRSKQDAMNRLEAIFGDINLHFYIFGKDSTHKEVDTASLELLQPFGFNAEWITDPIRLSNKAQVYCGEYNGEPIEHEFYYNKLKERMNESAVDC